MKKFNIKRLFAAVAVVCMTGYAQADIINDATLTRNGSLMSVGINFDFSDLKLKSNGSSVFTPMLINGSDTLFLNQVAVYGRTRWYQMERGISVPPEMPGTLSLRYHKDMEPVVYLEHVPYADWMNGSTLDVKRVDYGCATCREGEEVDPNLAYYKEVVPVEFEPRILFEEAVAEAVKTREVQGRAFVDFKVNQTVILPNYRRNPEELAKIIATIDSVRNDKDITVTSLH